jgi:mono/diheme cytochrome c family protein
MVVRASAGTALNGASLAGPPPPSIIGGSGHREVPLRESIAAAVLVSLVLVQPLAAADAAPASKAYKPTEAILEIYKVKCQACHMPDGNSPLEPLNFVDGTWKHGDSVKQIAGVISEGVPGSAMLPFKSQMTPAEVQALARYVRSFDKKPIKAAPKTAAKKVTAKPTKQ